MDIAVVWGTTLNLHGNETLPLNPTQHGPKVDHIGGTWGVRHQTRLAVSPHVLHAESCRTVQQMGRAVLAPKTQSRACQAGRQISGITHLTMFRPATVYPFPEACIVLLQLDTFRRLP